MSDKNAQPVMLFHLSRLCGWVWGLSSCLTAVGWVTCLFVVAGNGHKGSVTSNKFSTLKKWATAVGKPAAVQQAQNQLRTHQGPTAGTCATGDAVHRAMTASGTDA